MSRIPTFRYHWRHIPTGKEGIRDLQSGSLFPSFSEKRIRTLAHMRALVAFWNEDQPEVWYYWMEDLNHA